LEKLSNSLRPKKVLMLVGPRQVGKTSLIKQCLDNLHGEKRMDLNGDFLADREILLKKSKIEFENLIGDSSLLFIDEAQKFENINLTLKILVDNFPRLKIIVSGSAAFELMSKVRESLAGRLIKLNLFPIAQLELSKIESRRETQENLFRRMIYGSYPEVITLKTDKEREEYLYNFVEAFLFKDIFEYEGIKNSIKIKRLLQLLALQLGQEVSLSEIGSQLSMDKETVARYLDLLEKTFVIYERVGFSSGNLRKEISKTKRYYFYDNGVRNVLINNMNSLEIRSGKEIGQLWESYIITERLKYLNYNEELPRQNSYFWRTYNQSEIDLVEQGGDTLNAYEIKWTGKPSLDGTARKRASSRQRRTNDRSVLKVHEDHEDDENAEIGVCEQSLDPPSEWRKLYPQASFLQINRDNYLEFIGADF
jgi:predicted AAA+ superfamily ATPase